jgi:DNA-binding NtrC family response regulator
VRALETKCFFRVGGVKKVEVDVRLVAATNRDPERAVAEGVFRSDLLYRINSFEINIPPLRERREDIEPLTRHLLERVGGLNPPTLAPQVVEALRGFNWSGNVRQLRNCIERAVLLADNGQVTIKELPPEVIYRMEKPQVSVSFGSPQVNGVSSFQNASPGNLREVERHQILTALERTGWHRGKTAELLGISPSTLYRRLREYGLEAR